MYLISDSSPGKKFLSLCIDFTKTPNSTAMGLNGPVYKVNLKREIPKGGGQDHPQAPLGVHEHAHGVSGNPRFSRKSKGARGRGLAHSYS